MCATVSAPTCTNAYQHAHAACMCASVPASTVTVSSPACIAACVNHHISTLREPATCEARVSILKMRASSMRVSVSALTCMAVAAHSYGTHMAWSFCVSALQGKGGRLRESSGLHSKGSMPMPSVEGRFKDR